MSFYNLHTIYANSGSNWELWSYQAEFGDAVEQHIVKLGKKKEEKNNNKKNTHTLLCINENTDDSQFLLRAGQYHKTELSQWDSRFLSV